MLPDRPSTLSRLVLATLLLAALVIGCASQPPSTSPQPSSSETTQIQAKAEVSSPTPPVPTPTPKSSLGKQMTEIVVTTAPLSQTLPSIAGSYVIWIDARNNKNELWGKDLSSNQETRLVQGDESAFFSEVTEGSVVWLSAAKGKLSIKNLDLKTKNTTNIASFSTLSFSLRTDCMGILPLPEPRTSPRYVVWTREEDGEWVVWSWDRSSGDTKKLQGKERPQGPPSVDGNTVVWEDCGTIVGYDLASQSSFPISTEKSEKHDPMISGQYVVWEDHRKGNWDIFAYNLSTKTEIQVTANEADQRSPAISGPLIVWEDNRNGNPDIYGYNLDSRTEFAITTHLAKQTGPRIAGNIVVWEDTRNGNPDIYGAELK